MSDFTVDIAQNEYLPDGGDDVNAIVTVTSPDTGIAAPAANAGGAEIIIIDCSGSMRSPRTEIEQARAATAAAVDVIRDGVAFAVIAGTEKAVPIFPLDYGLAIADDQTRYLAKQAVSGVLPRGGTAMGSGCAWPTPCSVRTPPSCATPSCSPTGRTHTKPRSSSTRPSRCAKACSAATAGASAPDWEVSELRRISSALRLTRLPSARRARRALPRLALPRRTPVPGRPRLPPRPALPRSPARSAGPAGPGNSARPAGMTSLPGSRRHPPRFPAATRPDRAR